ncbi:hypothetical protein [Sphingobium fluviale]|nr:hypothetical protein [Sphingobium fluviale]
MTDYPALHLMIDGDTIGAGARETLRSTAVQSAFHQHLGGSS